MNESQQPELLEQYLALLRANANANANAAPPPGLDPEIAAFARKLAARPAPDSALKARVWQRALTAAQVNETKRMRLNGHRNDQPMPFEENNPMNAVVALPTRKTTPWFTLIAAAIAVSVFGFYLFNLRPESPRDPSGALAQQVSATPSPAASPTLIPSPTPAATDEVRTESSTAPVSADAGQTFAIEINPDEVYSLNASGAPLDGVLVTSPAGGQTSMTYVTGQIVAEPGKAPILMARTLPGNALPPAPVFTIAQPAQGPASVTIAQTGQVFTLQNAGGVTMSAQDNQLYTLQNAAGVAAPAQPGQPTLIQRPGTITVPAQGNQMYTLQDAGGMTAPAQPGLMQQGGTITVPAQPGQPSTFTLQSMPAAGFGLSPDAFNDLSQAQDVTPGTPVDGTLSADSPAALYRFVAPSDGLLNMSVDSASNNLFLAVMIRHDAGTPDAAATAEATAEAGTTARAESVAVTMTRANALYQAVGAPAQPPSPSTFVEAGSEVIIRVGGAVDQGAAKFTLRTALTEPKALKLGDSVEGDLNDKTPTALYSFEAQAGDVINAAVDGRDGFDTQLALLASGGGLQLSDDDSGSGFNPELSNIVIPQTGTYTLTIQPYDGAYGTSGHYTLNVSHQEAMSLDGGPQTLNFNQKQTPSLTFSGKANETVQLSVSIPADVTAYAVKSVQVEIVQNGQTITVLNRGNASGSAVGTLLSGPVTIPADGPVTVKVSAAGTLNQTGSLKLQVAVER